MSPAEFIDDPDWARFIPEIKADTSQRHLPTHEDSSSIDPQKAAMHLRSGGTLGSMPGYEERPGQIDMLSAVVRAFNGREHLLIEAGTGVGKSLAYLIPSVLWAWTNDTPVVISTATRNLQSQLMTSDIPKALAVLGGDAAGFKVALLKGRTNYLCLRATGEFFSAGYWTMSEEDQRLAGGFIDFLKSTEDGDLDGYDGIKRENITSSGEECGGRRCPFFAKCFIRKARRKAASAHLVVANHALVLAEATSGGGGILPGYGRLVLDEAHNLESIATEYLKKEFSLAALARILSKLIRRRGKGKTARTGGILAGLERQLNKGVLQSSEARESLTRSVKEITSLTVRAASAAEDLLDAAKPLLKPGKERGTCRYKTLSGTRMFSVQGLFRPYGEKWDEKTLVEAHLAFEAELASMIKALHVAADTIDGSAGEGEFNYLGDISSQARMIAASLVDFANETNFVLRAEKETHAYWIEKYRRGPRETAFRLVACPLSVAEQLRELVYEPKDSVILSSATLRVGNDFKYMSRRLGCAERFRALTAESPFDYLRQALVLAADCLPDPSAAPERYAEALAGMMKNLFAATDGRALVLFTSYEMMNAVAAHARAELEAEGLTLLVQGDGLSRESMTRELKTRSGTVVFGAQSFWEGVDVAGEALSCVVISRLPFAQVGDPVIEARSEKIDREGGSSFRDYALPEAVIKFRQGFGRLIRGKSDRGVVVITDPRIVTKNYGASFRKSIPASVHTVSDETELVSRVREFF